MSEGMTHQEALTQYQKWMRRALELERELKAFKENDERTYAARVEKMYSDFAAIEKKVGVALSIAIETGGLLKHTCDSARRIYKAAKAAHIGTP